MPTRYSSFILKCTALAALSASPLNAQVRTFEGPRHQGQDVSYCGSIPSSCGESMAMAWCRTQGYDYASDWAARAGNAATRSVRLDDGSVCEGAACESFAAITCGGARQPFTMPALGSAAKATVLAPDQRSEAEALEASEYRVLIPGCMQQEPGVFMCKSILEYQHCRTLMIARLVFSCRAGLAFDGGFAEPRLAAESDYTLDVESNATVRVTLGDRGMGQIRGKAEIALALRPPADVDGAWCLQRDSYVYYPTGPDGGMAVFGGPENCDATIEHEFEANDDDLIRAYDLCESFDAWGTEINDSIDVLIAGLFQMRSASPEFSVSHDSGPAVIAPYVHVEAPLSIDCRT